MAIDKLIPQYLNLDDDERILKSYEMVNALNVRISHEEDGDAGVIKNVEGNTPISPKDSEVDALPTSGMNRCIGVCTSEAHKCVYFFIYNSNGSHGIYRYIASPGTEDSNVFEKVYENAVLNFNMQSFIKADLVVNQNGEHLLYFTDNRNEPRKLNATRALAGGYRATINNGSFAEREDYLSVCKRPPMDPPALEFKTNESRRVNRIKNNLFQFAYQYVYDDGEYSALSPVSKLAIAGTHTSSTGESIVTTPKNNEIEVTMASSSGPVEKIILYVRSGNSGYYSKVTELKNNPDAAYETFMFANDGVYIQASDADTQKTYDSVPQRAATQVFSNNRLFYGNYVEGYDNIITEADINPIFYPESTSLSAFEIALLEGRQFSLIHGVPSRLSKFRLALGPDNEDWENIEWFGGDFFGELNIENLITLGVLTRTGTSVGIAPYLQYAVWQAGLDLLVPDTNKSLGGGACNVSNAVIHDIVGGGIGNEILKTEDMTDAEFEVEHYSMSFSIDMSDAPVAGFGSDATIGVVVNVGGSMIGTANSKEGGYIDADDPYHEVDIVLKDEDGLVLDHTPTSIHMFKKVDQTYDFHGIDYTEYSNVQLNGNLNGMKVESPLRFSANVDVSNMSKTQAGNAVAAAMRNLNADMFVRSEKYENFGPRERWRGSQALRGEGPDGNFLFPTCYLNAYWGDDSASADDGDGGTSFIYIGWSGFYKFRVVSATYSEQTGKVRCRIAPVGLTLEADEGLVGKFNTGANKRKENWFHAIEDECGDARSHTSVYADNQIECRVELGENVLHTGTGMITAINDFYAQGTVELSSAGSVDNITTFKSGATHDFGVVYFDNRGRHGGVQRIGSVEVPHLHDESRNTGYGSVLSGRTEIDIRLNHAPPKWASKFAPVYSKNTTYDFYLYSLVSEAFIPTKSFKRDIRSTSGDEDDTINNSAVIISGLGGDVTSSIFLSMRAFEGKPNSAKELMGSMKTYQYQEGDKLRIVSYVDKNGATQYPDYEIPITGYQYMVDDEHNPLEVISESSSVEHGKKDDLYRRTGWFLSIKEPNLPGFTRSDIQSATDYYSQDCQVQIIRYKKSPEDVVFYEMGEMFDIDTDGSGNRTHGGSRPTTSNIIVTADIRKVDGLSFVSSTRLYVGDRVPTGSASRLGYVDIVRIIPMNGGSFLYIVDDASPFTEAARGTSVSFTLSPVVGSTNTNFPGCLSLNRGDSYLRLRRLLSNPAKTFEPPGASITSVFKRNPTIPREAVYRVYTVEDDSVSDFFESNSYSLGRAHIETPDIAQMRRISSITYSDPFAYDSTRLNLSSFNPTLFPYTDMPSKHGEVTAIVDGNESLTVLQESKVSLVPINRNLVQMGADSSMVTSTEIVGTPTFMAGSFGPGVAPDGVVERVGVVYFADVRAGRVCQITGQGIEPISETHMESYFEGLFGGVNNCVAVPKIPSGFDPENGEYIVTTEPIDFVKLVVDESTVGFASAPPADAILNDLKVQPTFSTKMLLAWDTEKLDWDENDWDEDCTYVPDWDEMHAAVMYVDRITERSGVYVDPEFENPITGGSLTSYIKIGMVNQQKTYRGVAKLSLVDHTVDVCPTMVRTTPTGGTVLLNIISAVDPEKATVAWSPKAQKWLTFYSFYAEMYANIQNRFFSFKNGQMYHHNKNSIRNNFYDTQYTSKMDLISKANPSSIKFYKAVSLEGSKWDLSLINDKQKVVDIDSSHLKNKEGLFYANIPRVQDNNIGLTGNQLSPANYRVIGAVASVDSSGITFTGDIDKMPVITNSSSLLMYFRSGNNAWTAVGSSINSVANKNTVTTSSDTSSTIQADDIIANVFLGGVDGESFRSYYAKIEMESDSTEPIELYALNLVYEPSSLHNDGGQPNNQ